MSERPAPTTVGELRASGHVARSVRAEIRDNLLAALAAGHDPWPGLHGFGGTRHPPARTRPARRPRRRAARRARSGQDPPPAQPGRPARRVVPGHRRVRAGRAPVRADHRGVEAPAAERGDDLPVEWRHRDERYAEKLATPDTSVADLIGDVDPMRVAEGRRLGDPETIHFGLIPRSHRGIVAINELPDLAERIQVAMLNVMEERDIQIRGYVLRLPLDVLVVASANPEDYTNRGRIITPLKDRFGAEIRTHYPRQLDDEVAVIRQEAHLVATVPDALVEIVARFTRALRASPAVDQRRGCPPGSPSPAPRRSRPRPCTGRRPGRGAGRRQGRRPRGGTRRAARQDRVRVGRGGPRARGARPPAAHLDRRDLPQAARRHRPAPIVDAIEAGALVTTGERVSASEFLQGLPVIGESDVYDAVCERLDATTDGERASAVELALEGLYLARRIAKDSADGETVYG